MVTICLPSAARHGLAPTLHDRQIRARISFLFSGNKTSTKKPVLGSSQFLLPGCADGRGEAAASAWGVPCRPQNWVKASVDAAVV